jgi:hypothetical protein
LNLSFEGAQYDASFILADVETNEVLPGDELHLCPSEFGPLAIFPMSATRSRVVATVVATEGVAPSLEFVRAICAVRAPARFEVISLGWSSFFRVHHRHVARMSVGRIFIAGDAAHIHSPFGGQGMNTGLQDVWNLAWKLHFAVRGCGGKQLLDSYDAERLPVIKGVIQTTHRITRAMGTANKLAQTVRDMLIPVVSRLSAFRTSFVRNLSELGISYRGSPIVEGPGNRFWDDSLRGGKGIENRFLLFLGDDANASAKAAACRLCESFGGLVELRETGHPGLTLVRPDGYIACAGAASKAGVALESMRLLLKRQTS